MTTRPARVQHMSPTGGNRAAGSDPSDPPSLNQNVASSGHWSTGSIDDPNVADQHRFSRGRRVGDGPADLLFTAVG